MQKPSIKLENVSCRVANRTLIQPSSLSLEPGTFLSVVGPSGCGKSTLLKMIAGVMPVSGGRIHLNGIDVTEAPPERRDVRMVWQSQALFPHMTVGENVGYGLTVRGVAAQERERQIREWLDLIDLSGFADRPVDRLSGGERQRVALARALIMKPPVLLLDEPFSGLDARRRAGLLSWLRRFHRDWAHTILLVTHDLSEALTHGSMVAVMRNGRLEQVGPPRHIVDRPSSAFVAEFVGSRNVFAGTLLQNGSGQSRVNVRGRHLDGCIPDWAPSVPPIGSSVACAVSPKQVRRQIAGRGEGGIPVTVELIQYYAGATYIEYFSEQLGTIRGSEDGECLDLRVGDSAHIGWSPEDALILPE